MFYIREALPGDIDEIMAVEDEGFIEPIREDRNVYNERLLVCKGCFYLLCFKDEASVDSEKVAGYFCSEIWNQVPDKSGFTLGHSALKAHKADGKVLYISSIAIKKAYRGNGTGRHMFNSCVSLILQSHPSIQQAVLLVNEEWTGARKIYSDASFVQTTLIEDFFQSDNNNCYHNGIVMQTDRASLLDKCSVDEKIVDERIKIRLL